MFTPARCSGTSRPIYHNMPIQFYSFRCVYTVHFDSRNKNSPKRTNKFIKKRIRMTIRKKTRLWWSVAGFCILYEWWICLVTSHIKRNNNDVILLRSETKRAKDERYTQIRYEKWLKEEWHIKQFTCSIHKLQQLLILIPFFFFTLCRLTN